MRMFSGSNSAKEALRFLEGARSSKADVEPAVRRILNQVRTNGDRALYALTEKFDRADLKALRVTRSEIQAAYKSEDKEFLRALRIAKRNIEKFHKTTFRKRESVIETQPGVQVWREFRPIESVGLYVPGGRAVYPSTVLMLAVPAKIAGCSKIVLCVPPARNGEVPSAVLVAADICGITDIFKIGGAQAIGAMAYGTETVPKVSKIFGPGNAYVTTAKMLVYGEVAIDMPAGPSEVAVIADGSANASWIAADLLSQLEHGEDSQALLVTFNEAFARSVDEEIERQTVDLPRMEIIKKSVLNSCIAVVPNVDEAITLVNAYAPEHLEIVAANESAILKLIMNAGSVFLGCYSSEPLGDYATGSNHTLPTSGYARMFPPLSVESFGKMMQVQKVSAMGIKGLRDIVETFAKREGLEAHRKAAAIRFKKTV